MKHSKIAKLLFHHDEFRLPTDSSWFTKVTAQMNFYRLLLLFSIVTIVSSKINSLVEVYDNVFDGETAEWLHNQVKTTTKSNGDESICFAFPLQDPSRHSTVEQLLNQILLQLYQNGEQYYVEYWDRDEWLFVDAHADIDEEDEEQMRLGGKTGYGNNLKHPETGHVLYLKVGTEVRGPTVVWNVTRGGDLTNSPDKSSEMIIIPAVQGRLARFQGNLLHSVPRPADVFWTRETVPDGNNDECSSELYLRSVLLFTTWPAKDGTPEGVSLSKPRNNVMVDNLQSCNPIEQWKKTKVVPTDESLMTSKFQVPMMGDEERRGMDCIVARLQTQESARGAFSEEEKVTSVLVEPEQNKPGFSFCGVEF